MSSVRQRVGSFVIGDQTSFARLRPGEQNLPAQVWSWGVDTPIVGIEATSSVGGTAQVQPQQSYEGAMLRKVNEVTRAQGEATLDLIESATPSHAPSGTGSLVNDVA